MEGGRKRAVVRAGIFCAVLAVLAFAAWKLGLTEYLQGPDALERLRGLVDANLPVAIAAYLAAVAVGGSLLALPGVLFALVAGVLFGPWLGTACCVVGATAAAVLSFMMGRTFLKGAVKPVVMRNDRLRRWLFEDAGRNAVVMLLVTRMVPVFPFNLQNYAYGITDVKLSTYTWCTFAFTVPGTALYAFAAAGLVDEAQRAVCLGIAAALAVVVAVCAVVLRRRYDVA